MSNQKQALKPSPTLVDISSSANVPPKPLAKSSHGLTANTGVDCAGRHFIADFWGATMLDDTLAIEKALREAADIAGAVLLHIHLHKFSEGGGVTGVALLAESHISVHTWPELNYAAFDIFMCGTSKPEKSLAYLQECFVPERYEIKEILRGQNNT